MRATVALLVLALGATQANAAPPTMSPTGELKPTGVCKRYMDFHRAAGGSIADGIAEAVATMTYNSKGQRVAERWWRYDTPVRIISHSYNAMGNLGRTMWRLTNKRLVLTSRYRYDRRGNVLAKTTDYPNKERWVDDFRYNAKKQLVRTRQAVNPKNGKVYAPTHYFTYKNGRIATERIDRDNNGKINERLEYRYNPGGLLASKWMKPASKRGRAFSC